MYRGLVGLVVAATAVVALTSTGGAAPRLDYAGVALNVLPLGQSGSLDFPKTATDQLALYDGLTPLFDRVTDRDVRRFIKSARFGPDGRVIRTERPRPGDGKTDDPGAAIMDAAWPLLADAALSPVLGPLVDRLAALQTRDDAASSDGSSYGSGWYGYLEKDLRRLLGRTVRGPYATRFCGNGALAACRDSLWAALDTAGATLAAAQGADPAAWRADATRERIRFGFLPQTARFTNRPTFQQVVTFSGHRPR